MSNLNNADIKSDELSLKDAILKTKIWGRYLISKWFYIGIIAGLGAAFGLFIEYYKKPIYKGRISFIIENPGSGASGAGVQLGGFASQFGLDMGSAGETFGGANLQDLVLSRNLIQKALLSPVNVNGKTQSLAEYYIEFKGFRKDWNGTPMENIQFLVGTNPDKFTKDQNSLMKNIHAVLSKKDLTVNMKKTGLSSIEVSSENELFCKYFAEALLEVASEFYVATKTKASYDNFMILKTQLDSMRRVLNIGVTSVAASIDANPNPNRARSVIGAGPQRKQIDVQANQAFYVQMIQNLESAKITLRKETPLVQVIDRPVLPLEVFLTDRIGAFIRGGVIGAALAMVFFIIRKMLRDLLNTKT
jgi:hypothetical protein